MRLRALLAKTETLDEGLVPIAVSAREVGEQTVTATNHEQQAAAAVMILGVCLEVVLQRGDSLAEDGHLDFRRSGVSSVGAVDADDSGFFVAEIDIASGFPCLN